MKSSPVVFRGLLIAGLVCAGGCATAPETKNGKAGADDYVWVTPLGSNVPVRVRKGEQAATASPTASMSGEQAANAIHGGGGQMNPPSGAGGP